MPKGMRVEREHTTANIVVIHATGDGCGLLVEVTAEATTCSLSANSAEAADRLADDVARLASRHGRTAALTVTLWRHGHDASPVGPFSAGEARRWLGAAAPAPAGPPTLAELYCRRDGHNTPAGSVPAASGAYL